MKAVLFTLLICVLVAQVQAVDYLKLADGKAVTVANAQTAKSAITKATEGVALDLYDRVTGVLLGTVNESEEYEIGTLPDYPLSYSFYSKDKKVAATVVGVERRKDDKVLPFGYLRVVKAVDDLTSGSLLFCEDGKALGFYYVDHEEFSNQGYVVPVQAAIRAHADYAKNGIISRSWAGLIVSPSGTVPEVVSVRPESPAAVAGLQKGDILTHVGGKQTRSYLESVDAFYYLIPGVEAEFKVLREGKEISLAITPKSSSAL